MVSTQWISTYGNTYFGVASAGAAVASLLIFITAFVVVCLLAKRTPSTINDSTTAGCLCMGFVALLLVIAQVLWTLSAAALNGVGFLGGSSYGGLYILAVLPLIFVIPLVVAALSPRLWKGHYNVTTASSSSSSKGGFCLGIIGFVFSAAVRAVGLKPNLIWSLMVSSLTVSALAFIGLSELCFCSNPTQVSSWASRRVDVPICVEGTICHSYFILGETPDTMTLVLQWVDGQEGKAKNVASVNVRVCEVADSTTAFDVNNNMQPQACATPQITVPAVDSTFFPYFYLSEDLRYISHVTLRNLKPSQGYRVEARLLDSSGINLAFPLATSILYPKTLPSSDPTAPDANNNITFVGGGDYYMGQTGIETLMAALQITPEASFIFIGGDLAYSNNMRTCYRRWDQFFVELTKARTNARGWNLGITVLAGNHESGGYAENDDWNSHAGSGGNADQHYFYLQYFPFTRSRGGMSNVLNTGTSASYFHSHEIGSKMGLIMLDSGCYVKVQDQVPFLQEVLSNWTSSSTKRLPIPMFHVPGYPGRSRPSSSDKKSRAEVKARFIPLFEQYNVSAAFQYHEHVYYRSRELDVNGNVLSDSALASGQRGIVYLGDGAMGVASSSRVAMDSGSGTSQVTYSEVNFAYSVTFSPSTYTLHVKAVSPTDVDVKNAASLGKYIDGVDVKPRW